MDPPHLRAQHKLSLFAAGNFIYVAGSDLSPERCREDPRMIQAVLGFIAFVLGVQILFSLVIFE
jgi:hypothetical protein